MRKNINIMAVIIFAMTFAIASMSFSTARASGDIKYIVESDKSVAEASKDLEAAIKDHGFGIMKIHNMKKTLKKKGFDLDNEAIVYEVCNPKYAS